MRKIIAILLAVMLMASMAISAYAVTPAFKIPNMPKIPEIKVESNFVQNIVQNWFKEHPLEIKFDFTFPKLG